MDKAYSKDYQKNLLTKGGSKAQIKPLWNQHNLIKFIDSKDRKEMAKNALDLNHHELHTLKKHIDDEVLGGAFYSSVVGPPESDARGGSIMNIKPWYRNTKYGDLSGVITPVHNHFNKTDSVARMREVAHPDSHAGDIHDMLMDEVEGSGFWKDFKWGFKKGFDAVYEPAKNILAATPEGAAAVTGIETVKSIGKLAGL